MGKCGEGAHCSFRHVYSRREARATVPLCKFGEGCKLGAECVFRHARGAAGGLECAHDAASSSDSENEDETADDTDYAWQWGVLSTAEAATVWDPNRTKLKRMGGGRWRSCSTSYRQ